MSKDVQNLSVLASSSGPCPENVELTTWLIASLNPGDLTRSTYASTPSYEDILRDKEEHGGRLTKFIDENPVPEMNLAQDILLQQQDLSKVRRRLATAACALTFFAGGSALGYNAVTDVDNNFGIKTTTIDRLERGSITGGLAGVVGGMASMVIALGQSGRLARRPAKKIVAKSNS